MERTSKLQPASIPVKYAINPMKYRIRVGGMYIGSMSAEISRLTIVYLFESNYAAIFNDHQVDSYIELLIRNLGSYYDIKKELIEETSKSK